MKAFFLVILSFVLLVSCSSGGRGASVQKSTTINRYVESMGVTLCMTTRDIYGGALSTLRCVYVSGDIVVCPLSAVQGAFSAKVNKLDNKQTYQVYGYAGYNIDDDLVALRVEHRQKNKLPTLDTTLVTPQDTLYTVFVKDGKTMKTKVVVRSDTLSSMLVAGSPLFDESGHLRGMANGKQFIDAREIDKLCTHLSSSHENIYDLRLKTNKVYPKSETIRFVRLVTTMGNIDIALSDLTPEYRDNFIKLTYDHFYDSLLVHRVLPNYLIQTGAADTKYAGADDPVGWQGPGYKLPMRVVPELFHVRGAVAASKLPQDHNTLNRSDGSQFYIVTGRKFTNGELDEIEKEYHKTFSSAQRVAYTSVGGAPYLDDDYTVFGRVISGMDVADKIASVKLNGDRPVEDIRIKNVKIIYR